MKEGMRGDNMASKYICQYIMYLNIYNPKLCRHYSQYFSFILIMDSVNEP